MYCPKLTEEEKELISQIKKLPPNRFGEVVWVLSMELELHEIKKEEQTSPRKPDEFYLGQGRNKAMYYAYMGLANATLQLEEAKEKLNNTILNYDKMLKDSPIYWDHTKTKDGWKDLLVGDAARDYTEEPHPHTGRCKLYLPSGEVVNDG